MRECFKIFNNSFFSNKMSVIRAGIHKMLVRIAKSENTDQTTSNEAVSDCGSVLFVYAFLASN